MNLPAEAQPFFYIVLSTLVVLGGLLGGLIVGLWRGFVWLEGRMVKSISAWSESKDFKAAVAEIVTQAASGWNDINNRLHEEHRRGVAELRKRDEERVDAVKRLHGRIDKVWERLGEK